MKHAQIGGLHILNSQSEALHFKCNVLLYLIFVQNFKLNLNSQFKVLPFVWYVAHKKMLLT